MPGPSDKSKHPYARSVSSEDVTSSNTDDERQELTGDTLQWLDEHCDWRPFGVEW